MFPTNNKVTAQESDAIHFSKFDPKKLQIGKFQSDDVRMMAFMNYIEDDGTERRPIIQCPVMRSMKGLEYKSRNNRYSMVLHFLGLDQNNDWGRELYAFREKLREIDAYFKQLVRENLAEWFPSVRNTELLAMTPNLGRTILFQSDTYDENKYSAPLPGMVSVNFPQRTVTLPDGTKDMRFTTNVWNIDDWSQPDDRELVDQDEYMNVVGTAGYYLPVIGLSCLYIGKGSAPSWGVSVRAVDIAPYTKASTDAHDVEVDNVEGSGISREPVCSFSITMPTTDNQE